MLALCILKDIAQPLSMVNSMVVLEPGLYANSMILVGSLIFGILICGLDVLDDFAEEVCDCFSDCDCDCDEHDGCSCCDDDDLDDDLDDLEFYEVECPHCSEKVYFDEDMIDSGDLVCPNCNEVIEMEIDV